MRGRVTCRWIMSGVRCRELNARPEMGSSRGCSRSEGLRPNMSSTRLMMVTRSVCSIDLFQHTAAPQKGQSYRPERQFPRPSRTKKETAILAPTPRSRLGMDRSCWFLGSLVGVQLVAPGGQETPSKSSAVPKHRMTCAMSTSRSLTFCPPHASRI